MKRRELDAAYARARKRTAELTRHVGDLEAEFAPLRAEVGPPKAKMAKLQKMAYRKAGRFPRDPDLLAKGQKGAAHKAGEGRWSCSAEPTAEQNAKAVDTSSDLDVSRTAITHCPKGRTTFLTSGTSLRWCWC